MGDRQDKAGTPFQKYFNSMEFLPCKSCALGTAQGLLPLSLLTHGVHSPTDNLSLSHFTPGTQNIQTFWKKKPQTKAPKGKLSVPSAGSVVNAAVAHNGQLWASSSYICCRINPIFLTHALGMKGLSCCPHFTDPFPSHLSVHQESFSPDPSTIRAELDGFITVILFCADDKLFIWPSGCSHSWSGIFPHLLIMWNPTWDAAAGLVKGRKRLLRKNFSPLYPLIKMLWNEDFFFFLLDG